MVNPPPTSRFWLNATTVLARLEERHLTHANLADALGLSRSYWSQLVHRKRSLSPQVRRALLAAPALAGLSETQRTPPERIDVALERLRDWRERGAAED